MFASGVVISVEVKTVPSKVKFVLSSNSPLVPARTTLPSVKSETFAVAIVVSVVICNVAILATAIFASGTHPIMAVPASRTSTSKFCTVALFVTYAVETFATVIFASGV